VRLLGIERGVVVPGWVSIQRGQYADACEMVDTAADAAVCVDHDDSSDRHAVGGVTTTICARAASTVS
jgi:hypothetical protein